MDASNLLLGAALNGALDGILEMEAGGPTLLVLPKFLLAVTTVDLAGIPEDDLVELSLEVEDLVECTLVVVEEPNKEDFDGTAGFGNAFLKLLNVDVFDG